MSSVVELTPNDFDNPQKLKSSTYKGITIVKFYSPNCIHCVNSQPAYEKLAITMANDKTFKVAQIDCSKNAEFINKINSMLTGFTVQGYPTYIIFVNSLFLTVYEGGRDTDSMMTTLNNVKTGTGIVTSK